MKRDRYFQYLAVITAGALLYTVLGFLSLQLAFTQANTSAVWPLAGLGIGVLARFGFRYWPVVLLGAFGANCIVNLQNGAMLPAAILAALGIAVGNTAESLSGAWLARRALGTPAEFRSVDGVFRFVCFTGTLPPVLSAVCGTLSLYSAGILPHDRLAQTALTWFTGNVGGILTCSPLFLVGNFRIPSWKESPGAVWEGLILTILLVFVGQAVGGMHFSQVLPDLPKAYMVIPLILWIACRLGRQGAVFGVLLAMGIGVYGTMRGFAAFPSDSPEQSLLSLQLFIVVVAVVGLTVSVLMHQTRMQRRALEAAYAEKSIRLAAVTQEKALLTASAVHDLQSPLSGMRNLLRLVQSTPEIFSGREGRELIAEMLASVERMFGLVTDALSASSPERKKPDTTDFDLNAMVQRVIAAETAHATSKHIRIHQSLPVRPVIVQTQGALLEHIGNNFLSNAVKFSSPGTAIHIDLEQTPDEVIISVTDQGPGIEERDRARIFSGKAPLSIAQPTGGERSSGMGLYLAAELAQRLGAKLNCEASPSGGSVFTVTLTTPK